ncbi:MAG: NPCBM/NEW2 domain-containing protein [Limisphaerales bacterium]
MQVISVLNFNSPEGKLNECELFSAFPPDFGHQHPSHCSLYVNGRLFQPESIVEESSYHRPLLFAQIPGYLSDNHTNLLVSLKFEITLVGRHLKPGPMTGSSAPLQAGELELALQASSDMDCNSPAFGSWLDQQGLRRKPGETAITFARRACNFAGHHLKWVYPPKRAKLSIACNFTEGDCGSYSQLFVGICRANGIPARSLIGFWVSPGKGSDMHPDGTGAGHAKSEFYAAGVGWVPVDANNLQFGEEGFNFVAMIVGDELPHWHVPHVGPITSTLQGPMIFAIGGAGANASKKNWNITTDLKSNERISRPAGKKLLPLPDVYLGELTPLKSTIGWGTLGNDYSVGGRPLAIDGWQFEHGIGTHASSELIYELRPEYKRLVAMVGVDDEMAADSPASVVFQVFFDDHLAEETSLIRPNQAVPLNLPVPEGSSRVRLVVNDGGDGANSDHADWCNAGFITTDKETKADPAERLKELKELFDKGQISQDTYDQKRKLIMDLL